MPVEQERQIKVNVANTSSVNVAVTNTPNVAVTNTPTVVATPVNVQGSTTNTPILALATYTGTSFSTVNKKRIIGSCFAEQDGFLFVFQSWDDTNWDVVSPYVYSANELLGIDIDVVALYARVDFVNGGVNQTAFRLTAGGASQ
jgi:hypothetical protein